MFPEINSLMLLAQKLFFVLGAIFYLFFSIVVVKQTTMMSKNVKDKFNAVLITFSYLHLGFSVFLILLTLLIL